MVMLISIATTFTLWRLRWSVGCTTKSWARPHAFHAPARGLPPPPPLPYSVQNDKYSPAARAPGARVLAACFFFFFLSARVPGRDTLSLRASTGRAESCPCGMFLAGTHASHNVTLAFRLPHVNLNLLSPLALLPTSPCPRPSHVSNPLVEPYLSLKLKDRTPVLLILLTYFHLVRRLFFF